MLLRENERLRSVYEMKLKEGSEGIKGEEVCELKNEDKREELWSGICELNTIFKYGNTHLSFHDKIKLIYGFEQIVN
jgi:hypothetical protein